MHKINKRKDIREFKPKRIILGGVAHEVNNLDELNKIRRDMDDKKKIDQEIIEEEKTKKILVKKIHAKNMDVKTIKIITEIGNISDGNLNRNRNIKPPVKQKEPDRPKLIVKQSQNMKKIQQNVLVGESNSINSIQRDLYAQTSVSNQVIDGQTRELKIMRPETRSIKKKDDLVVEKPYEDIQNEEEIMEKRQLSIKTHDRKPINNNRLKKINDDADNSLPVNEEDNQTIKMDEKPNNDTKQLVPSNIDGFYTKQFEVLKTQWYVLALKTGNNEQGLLKILEGKAQIFPLLRVSNDMFHYKKFGETDEYRIYFKTSKTASHVDIYIIGLTIKDIRLQQVTYDVVSKSVDLWKLRKMYDLEFIKYYITNTKFDSYSDKFFDRFNADYELYKDLAYFDKYLKSIKIDTKNILVEESGGTNVLYLMYSSIEYESYGYTIRSHHLIKNGANDKYKIHGATRYGYPYDRENGYFKGDVGNYELDGVNYLKLLNGTDNFNSNNILDYLKKYIVSVIKMAIRKNVKIIHATTNYWNGIAAVYAAKYLGIKSIYELRGLWDEGILFQRPEVKNSDMLKMMKLYENKIYDEVDQLISINEPLKGKLVDEYNVPEEKISIIPNGVDTLLLSPLGIKNEQLRNRHGISMNTIVIGYIGTISNYEGLDYVLKAMKKLNRNIKFVVIGDGLYKNDMEKLVGSLELDKSVLCLGKLRHSNAIEYYNMFDIVAYPRKQCDLCNNTSSYKIFEAMSMEKPVIVSDLDAYNEIITNNENGLVCEPDNVDDLVANIELLIDDVELRTTLGKNARQWVINSREWYNIGQQLRDVYDSL